MSLSRKTYERVAAAIKVSLDVGHQEPNSDSVARTARFVAEEFKRDNPRFEPARFYEACGLDASGFPTVS